MKTILLSFTSHEIEYTATLQREMEATNLALQKGILERDYEVVTLFQATSERLAEAIEAKQDTLCLFLHSSRVWNVAGETDEPDNLDPIVDKLGKCKELKLVILNGNATVGRVKMLLSHHIPAVIGISSLPFDESATLFSGTFFKEMAVRESNLRDSFDRAMEFTTAAGLFPAACPNQDLKTLREPEEPICGLFYEDNKILQWTLPENAGQPIQAEKKLKTKDWALLLGIILGAFLLTVVVFAKFKNELLLVGPPFTYIVLFFAAIFPASILAYILNSDAKYEGSIPGLGGNITLTGPAALFFIILGFGAYQLQQVPKSFSYTVNVFSESDSTEILKKGEASLLYGDQIIKKEISEGQVTFKQLPSDFKNNSLLLIVNSPGYISRQIQLNTSGNLSNFSSNIYLKIRPDQVRLSGSVIYQNGQPVKNAEMVFADGKVITTTDEYGNYAVDTQFKDGSEIKLGIYIKVKNKRTLVKQLLITVSETSGEYQI